MKHLNITAFGRVQGVFFRETAREEAMRLGLTGYARNEPDGSVHIEAEGEEAALQTFLAWCRKGPPRAKVEQVEVAEGEIEQYESFRIAE